jgi:hypothetical protein
LGRCPNPLVAKPGARLVLFPLIVDQPCKQALLNSSIHSCTGLGYAQISCPRNFFYQQVWATPTFSIDDVYTAFVHYRFYTLITRCLNHCQFFITGCFPSSFNIPCSLFNSLPSTSSVQHSFPSFIPPSAIH